MDAIQQKQPEIGNSKDDESNLTDPAEKEVDSSMQPKGVGAASPDVGMDGQKSIQSAICSEKGGSVRQGGSLLCRDKIWI